MLQDKIKIVPLDKLEGEQLQETILRYLKDNRQKELIEHFASIVLNIMKSKHVTYNFNEIFSAGLYVLVQIINDKKFFTSVKPQFILRKIKNLIISGILGEMVLYDPNNPLTYGHKSSVNCNAFRDNRKKVKCISSGDCYDNGDPKLDIASPLDDITTLRIEELKMVLPEQLFIDGCWLSEPRQGKELSISDCEHYKLLYDKYILKPKLNSTEVFVFKNQKGWKGKNVRFSKQMDNCCARLKREVIKRIKVILRSKKIL